MINRFYNSNLTIKENIDYIEEMTGTRFSERTIKNWKKENGLTREYNSKMKEKIRKKLTIEEQDAIYVQLTDKSAKSIMAEIGVSQKTAYRIIERNNATSTTQQPKTETPIVENIAKVFDIEKESNNIQLSEKEIIKIDYINLTKNNIMYSKENLKEGVSLSREDIKNILGKLGIRFEDVAIKDAC